VVGRRDPLQELLNLQERINRLFEESLGRGRPEAGAFGSGSWVPLADAYETEAAYFVLLELPGLTQDDVELVAEGRLLSIRGARRLGATMRPESFYRMERTYGAFVRVFEFDQAIDPDRIEAQFRDGLLRLQVPKARARSEWRVRAERAD
jgi:HSP20 family protein